MPGKRSPNNDVFINCPFDPDFLDILRAIVFTVRACGYRPRCALDDNDSGAMRMPGILNLIEACDWGIHDLSAVKLDPATKVPRFNMPLELGASIGAKRIGGPRQRIKRLLILEQSKHRYDASTSDLSGQDVSAHHGTAEGAIKAVRDWLSDNRPKSAAVLPGGGALAGDYRKVRAEIDKLIAEGRLDDWEHMTHQDYLACLEAALTRLADPRAA